MSKNELLKQLAAAALLTVPAVLALTHGSLWWSVADGMVAGVTVALFWPRRPWRRRRRPAELPPRHRGIRLRIWAPGEGLPIVSLDCESLYYIASACTRRCRCGGQGGWHRLAAAESGAASLYVEIRPAEVTTLESAGL